MNDLNIHKNTIVHKGWDPVSARFEYSFEFAFRTRNDYMEFRRLWKQTYATLSTSIRDLKTLIKSTMCKREYAGKLQNDLMSLKIQATVQLMMRAAAKKEANRQYLEGRRATLPEQT